VLASWPAHLDDDVFPPFALSLKRRAVPTIASLHNTPNILETCQPAEHTISFAHCAQPSQKHVNIDWLFLTVSGR
jgi:hypothetical protein